MSARKRHPPGLMARKPPAVTRSYNVPFKDHTGKPALMSWFKSDNSPGLPFLSSWVFYMVNPDVFWEDFDGCAFTYGLEDNRLHCTGGGFRYEFFFLPGATAEECVAHYRGEMGARGTIWRQIRRVKAAMRKKKHDGGEEGADGPADDSVGESSDGESQDGSTGKRLPGLVWPKDDEDCYFINYRGWLFMYPDADVQWGRNQDHPVDLVKFNPIPLELGEGEVAKWDPMEHPIHSVQMSARGRKGLEAGAITWMEDRKHTHWEEAADIATVDATALGWESW
ncbi:hypothetical protein B0J13DRAFT_665034 [Dactylonectria estremocensis]|uniref:Uncharacterized protein n=1 Tax=Dactylonectria estremocensis TaxID=1079267 RepID=A0A9P9EXI4_9HYPO|nr:hypothetical protein B0J13DRAFT_665034 [Dactylonectria estremocensis]